MADPFILSTLLVAHLALHAGNVEPFVRPTELAGFLDLPSGDQRRAIKNYNHFQSLSPEDRTKLRQRYDRWKGLSTAEKAKLREQHKKTKDEQDDEASTPASDGADQKSTAAKSPED